MIYRALLVLLLFPLFAFPYSVVRKDGKVFTGELVRQSPQEIIVKGSDGVTIQFRADQIDWDKTTAELRNEESQKQKEIRLYRPEDSARQPAVQAERWTGERLTFDFKDIDIRDFFLFIANFTGMNVILDPAVKGSLTMKLQDVPWDQALDLVCRTYGYGYEINGNVVNVGHK